MTTTAAKPRYRDLMEGGVQSYVRECEAAMRNQLQWGEHYILAAEDTPAWGEFQDWLTEREMRAAFKRAQKVTP